MQPAVERCVMLPQCPIWMLALAPSAWMSSVILRNSGTIAGRSHSCVLNDSADSQMPAYASVVIPTPPRATDTW